MDRFFYFLNQSLAKSVSGSAAWNRSQTDSSALLFFLAGMLWSNSNKDVDTAFNQGCHVAI